MNRAERRAQWLTQHRQQQAVSQPATPQSSSHNPASPAFSPQRLASLSPQSIQLHIETLSLQGFPPLNRHAIQVALEHELTQLVAQQGLPPAWRGQDEIPHLQAGSFRFTPGMRGQTVGMQIAQALYSTPHPGDRPSGGQP